MFKKTPRPKRQPDYVFAGLVALLIIFGLVMLASASSDLAQTQFNDGYHYLKHQIIYGLSIGILGFFAGALIYYQRWRKLATILLILNIIALILLFTPMGISLKGATRWLEIGAFSFQPGELIKLTFFIYIAAWSSKNKNRGENVWDGFIPFLVLLGSVILLLLLQPATTTAFIIFVASLMMYFVAGARWKFIAGTVLLAVLAFSVLIYASPYRMERITTFFNPESDVLDSSYHINQALIAIGSGGWTGVGYGQSTTKIHYLPEPIGDSIFAVIAEELGFIGAGILIILFLTLVWRGLYIAKRSQDKFGTFLAVGFISLIGVQALINIAAISAVFPLTGVPLPFISFGGTAMAVFLTMSGIIVNISRY